MSAKWVFAILVGVCLAATSAMALPVVLSDDFNDNDVSDWSIAPMPYAEVEEMHRPARANAHNGVIEGYDSGYGNVKNSWMVKEVAFDGQGGLAIECAGKAGAGAPNHAEIYLLVKDWAEAGRVYKGPGQFKGQIIGCFNQGYELILFGEGSQDVRLYRHDEGGNGVILFQWRHNVTTTQTYRVERNALGQWSLYYGDANGGKLQRADIGDVRDATYSSFGYVGIDLLRSGDILDAITVEAAPVQEQTTQPPIQAA